MMTFVSLLNILPLFCYWFKPRFRFWINGCAWNKKNTSFTLQLVLDVLFVVHRYHYKFVGLAGIGVNCATRRPWLRVRQVFSEQKQISLQFNCIIFQCKTARRTLLCELRWAYNYTLKSQKIKCLRKADPWSGPDSKCIWRFTGCMHFSCILITSVMRRMQPIKHCKYLKASPLYGSRFLRQIILIILRDL